MSNKIPLDMVKGYIHKTNNFGFVEVIEYVKSTDITVRFVDTGYITKCQSSHLRRGFVKDKMVRNVYGVGFLGDGIHKAWDGKKDTRKYKVWSGMIQRCYSNDFQDKRKSYIGCTVCDEWHNFQSFGDWYDENYPRDGKDYDLDKDIKIDGNKIYSPDTCLFVTQADNTIKATAKDYIFKSPEGEIVAVYNLRKFCRENLLSQSHMQSVSVGRRRIHKGWTGP